MLQAPVSSSAYRRGHAHKRSAAISGDFDLEFFKQSPSINQQLSSSFPSQQSSPIPCLTPKTPDSNDYKTFSLTNTPTIMIIEPSPNEVSSISNSPSPKARSHTRFNSWTYNNSNKTKVTPTSEHDKKSSTLNQNPLNYSTFSSSDGSTPDMKQQVINFSYEIPEATIDLDLASGVYHNPSTPKSLNSNSSSRNPIFHRRTESAPELEDFLKYKMFSSTSSNKNSGRNSAIFEEEEEEDGNDDDELFSSASSNKNFKVLSTPSLPSLSSQTQLSTHSNSNSNLTSTPNSGPMRRGISAKRYQNYYNNNLMLNSALKSSESLSSITKPPRQINSNKSTNHLSSPHSSLNSSSFLNSPISSTPSSRFKFESQVYDIPQKEADQGEREEESIKSDTTERSATYYPKPQKQVSTSPLGTPKNLKNHKKSNSLFSTISSKIKRNSNSVQQKRSISDNNEVNGADNDDDDDYLEGDSTLTPFEFGEPGPELDLTTMIPRYNTSTNPINDTTNNETNEIFILSPEKCTSKKNKKKFFPWRKK